MTALHWQLPTNALPLRVAAPHLHESLAPRLRRVPAERVDAYVRRRLGGAELEAVEDFLGTLASVGQAVLPVLLPAIGTVIGGPIGGAAGAAAGAAASAGIQAATADRKPAPEPSARSAPTQPQPQPAPPGSNGRAPVKQPAKQAAKPKKKAAPPKTVAAAAGPATPLAAAQLLTLLLSPELLQAFSQLLLGAAGGPTVEVHGEKVPVPAMLGLVAELADRAAIEAAGSLSAHVGMPAYLTSAEGDYGVDVTSDAARTEALWGLVRAARSEDANQLQAQSNDWWSWNGGL